MFSVYTVCFFGHRQLDDFSLVEHKVETLIVRLLNEHEYVEFLVGREGEFDQLVTSAILRCRKRLDMSKTAIAMITTTILLRFASNPLILTRKQLFKSEIEQ